jgi:hypothetical protein
MRINKKISPSGKLGLKRTTYAGANLSLDAFNVSENIKIVNSDLSSPQSLPVCYLCNSLHNVTTIYKAGGPVGVCDRCNGGQP